MSMAHDGLRQVRPSTRRWRAVKSMRLSVSLLLLGACAADGDPADKIAAATAPWSGASANAPGDDVMQPTLPFADSPPSPTTSPELVPTGTARVIPTDERPANVADKPPPAISGGTLAVTADGALAVAADPDRDRVSIVDVTQEKLVHTVTLEPGDEPGRVAFDDMGRVHVALRGAGAVVAIDLASGEVASRRDACGGPRGIAFDGTARTLRVACVGGDLVTLPVDGGAAIDRVSLGADLRDVIVDNARDRVFVSRFKRAEVLELDAGGQLVATHTLATHVAAFPGADGKPRVDALVPRLAWRMVRASDGGALVLHQSERDGEVELDVSPDATVAGVSPYGGGGDSECGGIVQSALSMLDASGEVTSAARISAVVAVDVALLGDKIAVAQAGSRDPEQPDEDMGLMPVHPSAGVLVFARATQDAMGAFPEPTCMPTLSFDGPPFQAIAVAFAPNGAVLAQSRNPSSLWIDVSSGTPTQVPLGGNSTHDTGHEIFHRDAGAGIACASCHAEGAEDGHVWHFSGLGARRTQALHVGLAGTAPFHWSGDMDGIGTLVEEVLVARMGGLHQSAERTSALKHWLFALPPPPPMRAATDPAVERGRALFEGAAACASCHAGTKLTNSATVNVGTGEALQVPSLVGVGYRAPWLHDGCAETLVDRFDPDCGGKEHGRVAELSSAERGDLVAYLESL